MTTLEELEKCRTYGQIASFVMEAEAVIKQGENPEQSMVGGRRFTIPQSDQDDGVSMNQIVKQLYWIKVFGSDDGQLGQALTCIKQREIDGYSKLNQTDNATYANTKIRQRVGNLFFKRSELLRRIAKQEGLEYETIVVPSSDLSRLARLGFALNARSKFNGHQDWMLSLTGSVRAKCQRSDALQMIQDGQESVIRDSIIDFYSEFGGDKEARKCCVDALKGWVEARQDSEQPLERSKAFKGIPDQLFVEAFPKRQVFAEEEIAKISDAGELARVLQSNVHRVEGAHRSGDFRVVFKNSDPRDKAISGQGDPGHAVT